MKRHLHFKRPHSRRKLVTLTILVLLSAGVGPAISQPHRVTSHDERIRRVYAEGDRLLGIAWGWSMTSGEPLRPGYEPVTPQPIKSGKVVVPSRVIKKRDYPYPADYTYLEDQVWKKDVLEVEQKFRELIAEYLNREGTDSKTVANLRDHLSRLYGYSGNGDSQALDEQVRNVLWPTCPLCSKSDQVSMLSPIPQEYIEAHLKHGWWFCQGCSKEFRAKRSEAR